MDYSGAVVPEFSVFFVIICRFKLKKGEFEENKYESFVKILQINLHY